MHKWVQKTASQIYGQKCHMEVMVCVLPPAEYSTESESGNAAGRSTSHTHCILHTLVWMLWGWSRQAPVFTLTTPAALITATLTWPLHPSTFLYAGLVPPYRTQLVLLFCNNHGHFPGPLLQVPRAAGWNKLPSYGLDVEVQAGKQQPSQTCPMVFFSFRIQPSPVSCNRKQSRKGLENVGEKGEATFKRNLT